MIYGVNVGKNVVFHFNTEIREPVNLTIGSGSIIGDSCILDARNVITIGSNVNFSSNVSVYTAQHDHRSPVFSCYNPIQRKQSVEIGDRAWIGCNVVILPGVSIGEGAVCCAGSVICKDIAPYSIVAGIPAIKISERSKNLVYEFNGHSTRLY